MIEYDQEGGLVGDRGLVSVCQLIFFCSQFLQSNPGEHRHHHHHHHHRHHHNRHHHHHHAKEAAVAKWSSSDVSFYRAAASTMGFVGDTEALLIWPNNSWIVKVMMPRMMMIKMPSMMMMIQRWQRGPQYVMLLPGLTSCCAKYFIAPPRHSDPS